MVRRQSEKRQQEQITTEQNVALSSPGLSLLYAWGDNTMGKLGIGDAAALKVPRPQLIAGIETSVTQVSCGADHTLILTKIGTVYQMGQYFLSSKKGEALKHGTLHKPKIVELPQHIHAMQVAAGGGHSIALMENHEVYTWGNNLHGSLGVGLSTQMCSN